jgi:hypothetical protein
LNLAVVICTHNPDPEYLRRVLAALREQSLAMRDWELLLVDNASGEPLTDRFDLSWHPNGRHVREERLGLAIARTRGIAESRGDLLVFVDDDNVLPENYLEEALKLAASWPQLEVFGGAIVPEFEIQPEPHLSRFLHMLALRDVASPKWSNETDCAPARPWGAGMCVRRSTALAYKKHIESAELQITDRIGSQLLCGGDDEFSLIACSHGKGVGIFPELVLIHLIPKLRLNERYLLRMARGRVTSHALLEYKWHGREPELPFGLRCILRFLYDLLSLQGINRKMRVASFLGSIDGYNAIRNIRDVHQIEAGDGHSTGMELHEPSAK